MLELAHALTGGVIAYKIDDPLVALPLALASHFVIDMLPHWNPHLAKEKKTLGVISLKTTLLITLDCLIGLGLGLFVVFKALPNVTKSVLVLAGCFLAILPDLVEAPFFFLNQKNKVIKKFIKFHGGFQFNLSFWPGILFQAFYIAFLLYLVR